MFDTYKNAFMCVVVAMFVARMIKIFLEYRQTSNIRHTEYQNLNVSRLILQ